MVHKILFLQKTDMHRQTGMVSPVSSHTFVPRARGRYRNHVHFSSFPLQTFSSISLVSKWFIYFNFTDSTFPWFGFWFSFSWPLTYCVLAYPIQTLLTTRFLLVSTNQVNSCVVWRSYDLKPFYFVHCVFIHFSALFFCMAHCALDFARCHRNLHYYYKYSTWTHL